MINFNLNLRNPWSERFENVWYKNYTITKNKNIEFQIYKSSDLIEIELDLTMRQDHAGLRINFGLVGYACTFNFYDSRHWNYGKKKWDTYE